MADNYWTAVNLAVNGHNIYITGQAGTGKSTLVRTLAKSLTEIGKHCNITATTGMASAAYADMDACTIHSWAGLADGRFSDFELINKITCNDDYEAMRKRVRRADVLIIDEISMLSARLFDQIELICRYGKDETKPFGGIQVIVAGDFLQLPPIPNPHYQDEGKFCFKSASWKHMTHCVQLTQVLRQDEPELIMAVQELAQGSLSPETLQVMQDLQRPLEDGSMPLRLCARKLSVDLHNQDCLLSMDGALGKFKAKDKGQQKHLKMVAAPKMLCVKVGAPVMLIKNISPRLVNGLRGAVTSYSEQNVSVNFQHINNIVTLGYETFTVYGQEEGYVIAHRCQIPLVLAFAITIHKSQGLTLDRLVIDCTNATQPGQLGVAVGRASKMSGLQILNFDITLLRKPPHDVLELFQQVSAAPSDDLVCCRNQPLTSTGSSKVECNILDSDESDFGEEELHELNNIHEALPDVDPSDAPDNRVITGNILLSCNVEVKDLLDEIKPDNESVASQHLNTIINNLNHEKLKIFVEKMWQDLLKVFTDTKTQLLGSRQCDKSKLWTTFYSSAYHLSTGGHYIACVQELFGSLNNTKEHFDVAGRIHKLLREKIVQCDSKHIIENAPSSRVTVKRTMSGQARGVIRYIGGMCVAKTKYHIMNAIRTKLYIENQQQALTELRHQVDLLEELVLKAALESKDPESLTETDRRQNIRQGLTNITDNAYDFFLVLDEKLCNVQTMENMNKHGHDLFKFVNTEIFRDYTLISKWIELFQGKSFQWTIQTGNDVENILTNIINQAMSMSYLFEHVTGMFLRVGNKQFLKNYIHELGVEKTLAHRKKVLVAKGKAEASFSLPSWEQIIDQPISEHSHLKRALMCKPDILVSSAYKVPQLKLLCQAYNITITRKDKRADLCKKLKAAIVAADNIPNHVALSGTKSKRPNSTRQTSKKRKCDPQENSQGQSDDQCAMCNAMYIETEEWVECDGCKRWMHRVCGGISDDDWDPEALENEEWYCPNCQ